MSTSQQQAYANQILRDVAQVNPYAKTDGMTAYLYAAGYLAGFIASLAEEDPYVYKRFRQHVDKQAKIPKPSRTLK